MAARGSKAPQIPIMWHLGYDQPFRIVRKRKGDRKFRSIEYASLTRSSAARWIRLCNAQIAKHRRDATLEALFGFGVVSIGEVQRQIRASKRSTIEQTGSK